MSEYTAKIQWTRNNAEDFLKSHYSRAHTWEFDGGTCVPASASPHIVSPPYSVEANVDPEEAFVASLSSCHMLFFLSLASKEGLVVDEYTDNAFGVMAKNSEGKLAMTKVTLRPIVKFEIGHVAKTIIDDLHHRSHELCFIANSVNTEVVVEMVE